MALDLREFTLHATAAQRAIAEADWLGNWCEELKYKFQFKGKNPLQNM